jgi:hypothetical protein
MPFEPAAPPTPALLPDRGKFPKKLKYNGRKKLFTVRIWSGALVEIAEKSQL